MDIPTALASPRLRCGLGSGVGSWILRAARGSRCLGLLRTAFLELDPKKLPRNIPRMPDICKIPSDSFAKPGCLNFWNSDRWHPKPGKLETQNSKLQRLKPTEIVPNCIACFVDNHRFLTLVWRCTDSFGSVVGSVFEGSTVLFDDPALPTTYLLLPARALLLVVNVGYPT